MLLFHSALAPYRIDQFNLLSELFDLEIVFYLNNVPTFKFDQDYLKNQSNFKISYLLKGPGKKNRFFRFGIYSKIKRTKPDVILSYEYSPTTHYLLLLKRLGIINQEVGTMVDDSLSMCYSPQTKARKISRNLIIKKLDFIVLLSNEVAKFYNEKFNIQFERIIISPIIQIEERLRRNTKSIEDLTTEYIQKYKLRNKKVLIFIGRLSPVKGLIEFLKNIENIISENKDLKIVIIGEGDEKENIINYINDNNFQDQIILPGRFENTTLYPWYTSASGFFLPSTFEPFGAVVNESLVFGTKVLCSELAGSSSLITKNNGIIFNPLNSKDTQKRTIEFISQIEPVNEINLSNRPSLMETHPHDYLKEWDKVYNL